MKLSRSGAGRQRNQRRRRRDGQEAGSRGGGPRVELAAVRREIAPTAGAGQGGGRLRLLDLGIAQGGAAGVQGIERAAVLSRAV
ncbi:hypothetical protein G6F59_018813 [Rhizopus arrhizus]|nr:hypothetical protein G6F59_018813 [Rhizopus arrhizus]